MSAIHVYIKPYSTDSGPNYVANWLEVTRDVTELGTLGNALDNTEYDVGVFRASNMVAKLRNDAGKYSDVGGSETVFRFKRSGTLVKITWDPGEGALFPGFFSVGPDTIFSTEQTLFQGVIDDTATTSDISDQDVDFQLLGFESMLSNILAPTSPVNGDLMSSVILACLNQSPFTTAVTVSGGNISLGNDQAIDDVSQYLNKTVLDVLKELLVLSNSVLYIDGTTVKVVGRTPNALAFTFYGPGSIAGPMNIQKIAKYRPGSNRIINFATWNSTSLVSQNTSSQARFGIQTKAFNYASITNNTTRNAVMGAIVTEFSDPKREFELSTPMMDDRIGLKLLDQVSVDFPGIPLANESQSVAIYGKGTYGVDYYADALYNLTIETAARFKVMGRKVDLKNEILTYSLREV